ncbi:hypothetical protein SCLCIDRAFT_27552 [Scleroderma citrinum Foug A]|uniref:Carboxypeptidase n=1 Tax=Scleroderma citrinum Foug A TaxID=1036808 RepID=A0A0C3DEM2_9AGAM|nr:hypothetical protein SCLCIDRAFT_27552 [Scleroderma citrinum Foug A]
MQTRVLATSLVYISIALASFLPGSQVVLHDPSNGPPSGSPAPESTLKQASEIIHAGQSFIQQDEIFYELQYSGYLDITDDKHLFFWFFESRNSPKDAPLVLWLNGGPGCTSSGGLLFELGPCRVADGGRNVTFNPYSWNTNANIIFLDQPVNVGFSYAKDGNDIYTSQRAARDVYSFLELFLNRFPEYSMQTFHLASESYGGTYAPHIASVIYEENQKAALMSSSLIRINLASLMIGNGITDAYIQIPTMADYLCEGPYPMFDDPDGPECTALRAKIPKCKSLIKSCRTSKSRLACGEAEDYCHTAFHDPLQTSVMNPYDARRLCDREKNGLRCYEEIGWVEKYMNNPKVKTAIGVSTQRQFSLCNNDVEKGFQLRGDSLQDTPAILPELVNNGIRLLIYAGVADRVCDYMGNERWLEVLLTKFYDEFLDAPTEIWITTQSKKPAGTVRTAGGDGTPLVISPS